MDRFDANIPSLYCLFTGAENYIRLTVRNQRCNFLLKCLSVDGETAESSSIPSRGH
jgi:hypothetical protein